MTDVADGVCAEDTWLVAVQGEVATPDVHLWWNCKETPDLDARIEQWPRIRLGTVLTGTKSKDPDTPARRVTALLFLRGTLPEDFTPVETDPYVFPLLTEDLRGGSFPPTRPASMTPHVLTRPT